MIPPTIPACVGQATLLFDRNLEGWCWYPDAPAERALVDVLVNGRIVSSTKAARMRTDLRDLQGCDGYCGFTVSLGDALADQTRGVGIEVRERRLGQTIGRIIRPEASTDWRLEARLQQAEAMLDAASRQAAEATRQGVHDLAGPLRRLGQTFLHLSRGQGNPLRLALGWDMAAPLEALRAIPAVDLFHADRPHVSVLIPGGRAASSWDGLGLDRVLASAARVLRPLGAEFILVEDGSDLSDRLLPVRLRHLRVAPSASRSEAATLNAAALSARGQWLAFAWAGRLAAADLAEACGDAEAGTVYIDAAVAWPGLFAGPGPVRHHGLAVLCEKTLFEECGGLDAGLEGSALWADFAERAAAVQARVAGWAAPRPAFQPSQRMNEVADAR